MFLLIFGLVGYVAHAVLGWDVLFVMLVPLLLGAACAVGLTILLHTLFATSKETILTADDARLEGRLGAVTMAIRAGGVGEIIFTRKGGGRQSVGARSATGDAIQRDRISLSWITRMASPVCRRGIPFWLTRAQAICRNWRPRTSAREVAESQTGRRSLIPKNTDIY